MVFTLKKKSRQSITFGKTGLQCVNLWLKKYVEQQSETAFQQVNLGPNCCVRRLTETGLQHTSYYHPLPYTFCQTIFGNCTTTHRKLSNYATSSYIVVGIIVTTSRGRCCCFGSILCWNHWLVPLHQWGIQGRAWGDRPLPPLFLDQTEAQKAEKNFLGTARRRPPPNPFISGSGWPQPLIWRSGWALYHWGWFHAVMALNLKKLARLFQVSNPCLSLPSVATEDRKQFQCLLFLEFNWYEDTFWVI